MRFQCKKTNLDIELDTDGAEDDDNSADPFIASDQDVEKASISDEVVQQLLEDPEILKKDLGKSTGGIHLIAVMKKQP